MKMEASARRSAPLALSASADGKHAQLSRREILLGAMVAALAPSVSRAGNGHLDFETIVAIAEERAAVPHVPGTMMLKPPFADLDYDDYRRFEMIPERRLWHGASRFVVEPLPPGFLFTERVVLHAADGNAVRPVPFDPGRLWFGGREIDPDMAEAARAAELGWSGFRLTHPLNAPDVMDEIAVFQGASYFRAVARGLSYGLSARGLAIGTASPRGEEFPAFTQFWLNRPDRDADTITIYALLESESCTGAFRFVLRPGTDTVMDVRAAIRPRRDMTEVGIGPLTSMYWFADMERNRVDDHRAAVHDSDGLMALTGSGERLWRPLANPKALQVSVFEDTNPRGFGLSQRRRSFEAFLDNEADYHRRPCAWVEPLGEWGEGGVVLVEIPTDSEFHDNIVAFWQPKDPLAAGKTYRFDYRLTWASDLPVDPGLGRVIRTAAGRDVNVPDARLIAVDFDLGDRALDELSVVAEASGDTAHSVKLLPLPGGSAGRVALLLEPPSQTPVELRLALKDAAGQPASETWLYRWNPT